MRRKSGMNLLRALALFLICFNSKFYFFSPHRNLHLKKIQFSVKCKFLDSMNLVSSLKCYQCKSCGNIKDTYIDVVKCPKNYDRVS